MTFAHTWRRRFPALRTARYRWYLGTLAVSVVGTWMQSAAQGWYVQTLTADVGSEYWLGVAAAVQALPVAVLTLVGGYIADRFPRRPIVVAAQAAAAASASILGASIFAGVGSLSLLLVCAGITGATMAFDIPARQAFAAELVGRRALASAIGLNSTVFNMGRLVGPALAGAVTLAVGIGGCFVLNGLSFVPAILYFVLFPPPRPRVRADEAPTPGIAAGYFAVLRQPGVAGLLATMAAVQIAGGPYTVLTPALAGNVLGVREGGYSLLLFANGVGAVLGSLWVATLHGLAPRRRGGVLGALTMALGLALLSVAGSLWFAVVAMTAAGAGFVVFLTSTNSTLQLITPNHLRGRVVSLWILAFGASQPLGNLIAGWSAQWGGAPGVFARGAVGMVLCAVAVGLVHGRARSSPANDLGLASK